MNIYHKIDSIFERDMAGTKKLINGKYRDDLVEYLKDNTWIFKEKVDGTNVRIYWDGHKVSFGGRTENSQMPVSLVEILTKSFGGSENEQLFEQKFGEKEVTLYGEGYGPKIQAGGGNYREDVGIILFDVQVGNTWLDYEDVESLATIFNVPCVPIVCEGPLQKGLDVVRTIPMSHIAKIVRPMEGLVAIPKQRILNHMGRRVIVKIIVNDFLT